MPPPGKLRTLTETVSVFGAVPREGVAVSQAPPSEVLGVTVQFNVPLPPFPIWIVCGVAVWPGATEKLNPPGGLSKSAPDAATVKVTGMVIDLPGLANSVTLISPGSVPDASELA